MLRLALVSKLEDRIEALRPADVVACRPRIRIPGAPQITWIPASQADKLHIYIPKHGEHLPAGVRRPYRRVGGDPDAA